MSNPRTPAGLADGGRTLWQGVTAQHQLDPLQLVTLTEACRAKDRLDKLDELLRGDVDCWARLVHDLRTEDYELRVDAALASANTTATLLKQLLAALRLPDAAGKRSGARPPRGAYAPRAEGGPARVSSLEAARQRATGTA